MPSLAVDTKGQVTLKQELLQHLGVKPGERIAFDKLPDGAIRLKAASPNASIDGFIGLLAGRTEKKLTIEEMNRIAADGWAGKK